MKIVLDAWALLAFLQQEEPAASRVKAVLKESEIHKTETFSSIINIGEVFYNIGRRQGREIAEETLEELHHLPLTILPADTETVFKAARLKIQYTIYYADAFAVVMAQEHHATLITGDPELLHLRKIVSIEKLVRH